MELDGRPVDPAELATLALYNYGHFTSMRVDAGRVRGLTLHLDRLVRRSEEHTSELQSHRDLHSFPTRRSSDLRTRHTRALQLRPLHLNAGGRWAGPRPDLASRSAGS